jgi:hypothetical protein
MTDRTVILATGAKFTAGQPAKYAADLFMECDTACENRFTISRHGDYSGNISSR